MEGLSWQKGREGLHDSVLRPLPPPPSLEEGRKDAASGSGADGSAGPNLSLTPFTPEATINLDEGDSGDGGRHLTLDWAGPCHSVWNFSLGDTVLGSVLRLKPQKASSRG